MSRSTAAPVQRQLTLTEELERLEQSITLTLQEIDHNFSRAHRIVTSSILPVVEQYAEHSRNVWEGSKFWKQFFEASANVSLSGYEEPPEEEDEEEETTVATLETSTTDQGTPSSYSSAPHEDAGDFMTPRKKTTHSSADAEASSFSSPDYSTPRPDRAAAGQYASPYETLRREVQGDEGTEPPASASTFPSTPRAQTYGDDARTPGTATTAKKARTPGAGTGAGTGNNDVLLHRILDRNYRIQATPHAAPALPSHSQRTPGTAQRKKAGAGGYAMQLDLDSSPLEEAPRFSADLFRASPGKRDRVPGVSVLATPSKGTKSAGGGGGGGTHNETERQAHKKPAAYRFDGEDDEDDDDDFGGLPEGMSPPKTMQFYIPQSKLLKTPAKEASRQIVEDLLMTAGGPLSDDDDELLGVPTGADESPSVVGKGTAPLDESF